MLVRVLGLALSAAALTLPAAVDAATLWVDWTSSAATGANGTLAGGRTATFTSGTAAVQAINSASTGGAFYTSSPAVPGLAVGENADSVGMVTATPHPGLLNPGALIFEVELTSFAVDAETTLGLRDVQDIAHYRIELLDGNRSVLSLTGLQVANFNLTYNSAIVADLDVLLAAATGSLTFNNIHDAGSSYRHSGLALFSNLPTGTRFIRLLSDASFQQNTEGISFYLGGSALPEPAAISLLALASLALLAARRT